MCSQPCSTRPAALSRAASPLPLSAGNTLNAHGKLKKQMMDAVAAAAAPADAAQVRNDGLAVCCCTPRLVPDVRWHGWAAVHSIATLAAATALTPPCRRLLL